MNFASWQFLFLFLPAVTIAFFWLCRTAGRQWLLILASFLFYSVSGYVNLFVLVGSVLINFAAGALLTGNAAPEKARRKLVVWLAVIANLGCLLGFKLLANEHAQGAGFRSAADILMPLALSFVTLQQIGFVVACYKRQIQCVRPVDYLFFVFFFPQLIMGPIVRFQDIRGQLQAGRLQLVSSEAVTVGLAIFIFGLAKKTLLADQIFIPVERLFSATETITVSTLDAWYAMIAFQLQLLLDFSAYADMAIGLAKMFGIDLPINFDRPFKARNRFDLWRRWHISYVVFMRTHVFVPLVRHAGLSITGALVVTGILSGFWHGLGWTFIIWGLLHAAILLIVHHRRRLFRLGRDSSTGAVVGAIALTFLTTCLIGVFFRAPTIDGALRMYQSLFFPNADSAMISWRSWLMFAACAFAIWGWPDTHQFFRKYWTAVDLRPPGNRPAGVAGESWITFRLSRRWAIVGGVIAALCVVFLDQASRFIYVQF